MIVFKALLPMEAIAVYNHYRGLGLRIIEVEEFKHSYLLTYLTKEGHRLQYSEDKKVINKIAEMGIFLSDISVEEMKLIVLHCPCKGSIFEIVRESDKIHITLCDDDSIYNTTITVDELAGYSLLKPDTLTYEEGSEAVSETIKEEPKIVKIGNILYSKNFRANEIAIIEQLNKDVYDNSITKVIKTYDLEIIIRNKPNDNFNGYLCVANIGEVEKMIKDLTFDSSAKEELFYTLKEVEVFLTTKLIPTFGELITIRNNRIKKYSQLQEDLEAIKKAIVLLRFIDLAFDEFYSKNIKMLDFFDINVVQGADKDSIVIVITSNSIRVSVGKVVARSINSTSLEDIILYLHELQKDIEEDLNKFQTHIANDFLIELMKDNS